MSKPHVLSMKQYLAAGGDALFSGFACPLNKEVDKVQYDQMIRVLENVT